MTIRGDYAGIGSRKTPEAILKKMTNIARFLDRKHYTLRSGGADGADTAFEKGVKFIYPELWYADDSTKEAEEIAARYHPAWHKLKRYHQKLHGRNVFQVLGEDLESPSEFVICWTPDGCECHEDRTFKTGGTGTAISIASEYGIPVYNLANKSSRIELTELLRSM